MTQTTRNASDVDEAIVSLKMDLDELSDFFMNGEMTLVEQFEVFFF
jgi:hypothetical protein